METKLQGGGNCPLRGEPKILGWGEGGDYPLMGWSPHPTPTAENGQPWSNLLEDSRGFGQVGIVRVSESVLLCSFLNCHQSMGREGQGSLLENIIIHFLHVSEYIDNFQAIKVFFRKKTEIYW